MKLINKLIVAALCIGMASAVWTAPADDGESVVAVVGEKVITASEIRQLTANEEQAIPINVTGEAREKAVAELHRLALEHIINQELVYMDFQALKGKIPPKYVQERIDEIIVQQSNGDEEAFRDILHEQQVTWQEFKERIHRQVAVEMLLYDRTRRNLQISEMEIEEYYKKHQSEYVQERECQVQVIALKKNGRYMGTVPFIAQQIIARADKGENFDSLVAQYSEGPNAAQDRGMLDWQAENSLAPALAVAVKSLKVGQVYPKPVPLGLAFYIVKLNGVRGGKERVLDDNLKAQISKILSDAIAKERFDKYIHSLYIKFPVKRFDQ